MHNKIKVLLFSEISELSQVLKDIFSNEDDFYFQSLTEIDELREIRLDQTDRIIIFDLSRSNDDVSYIINNSLANFSDQTVIFLIEDNSAKHLIANVGAKTFEIISKPFSLDELFYKIRFLSSASTRAKGFQVLRGGIYFDFRKNEIKNKQGKVIKLTEKEGKIVNFLNDHGDKISSKAALLKNVWGYADSISTHTLETHIYRLRKKLKESMGEKNLIKKNKKGYYIERETK